MINSIKLSKFVNNLVSNEYCILSVTFFITYSITLFNNGVYWDGWTVWNVSDEALRNQYYENGNLSFYYIIKYIYGVSTSPSFVRFIIFLSYYLTTIIIFSLLKYFNFIERKMRILISLSYFLFPVNAAKITIPSTPYAVSVFLFFLGFYFLYLYLTKNKIYYRIILNILFLISFFPNSLLVFYALPLMFFIYHQYSQKSSIKFILRKSVRHFDLFVLPIFFWILKSLYFRPSGLFEDYNSITLKRIMLSPFTYIQSLFYSVLDPINLSIDTILSMLIYVMLIVVLIYTILKRMDPKRIYHADHNENDKHTFRLFILGFFILFFGVFAYHAVGQQPRLNGWAHRHQLLVPLGASFIVFYGLKFLFIRLNIPRRIENFVFSLLLAGFVVTNLNTFIEYQRDWFKQLSLIEHFKNSDIIKNNTTFMFINNTNNLDVNHSKGKRVYRFFEYTGLMKYAFGTETRFGVDIERYNAVGIDKYRILSKYPYNSMSNYSFKEFDYNVIIENGEFYLKSRSVLKLLAKKILQPDEFKNRIADIIQLRFEKVENLK